MIRYTLKCSDGHQFDSWFANADGFESLKARGLITCAICGGTNVSKSLMAPAVTPARKAASRTTDEAPTLPTKAPVANAEAQISPQAPSVPSAAPQDAPLSTPASPQEAALSKMRAHLEANSEDVGKTFAQEARAMHEGATPDRAIHGEASPQEAKALLEDGVPVLPLPFLPKRKTN